VAGVEVAEADVTGKCNGITTRTEDTLYMVLFYQEKLTFLS